MPNMIRKTTKSPAVRSGPKGARLVTPPGKKGLDRALVLHAACDLCDEVGLAGLTIKALAERLGIRPPSVYAHYDGLGDLRRDLALWGYAQLADKLSRAVVGLSGARALVAAGGAYLGFIRQSPGLYAATVTTPAPTDAQLRDAADAGIEVLHRILASMDLSEHDQIHALRGLRSIVHGFGQLEANGAFQTKIDRNESFARVLQTFVDAVQAQGGKASGEAASRPGKPRRARSRADASNGRGK